MCVCVCVCKCTVDQVVYDFTAERKDDDYRMFWESFFFQSMDDLYVFFSYNVHVHHTSTFFQYNKLLWCF